MGIEVVVCGDRGGGLYGMMELGTWGHDHWHTQSCLTAVVASTLTPPSSSLITSSVLPSAAAAISIPSSSYSDINMGEQRSYYRTWTAILIILLLEDVVVKAMFAM